MDIGAEKNANFCLNKKIFDDDLKSLKVHAIIHILKPQKPPSNNFFIS